MYSVKSGSIRIKMVVFEQMCCIRAENVYPSPKLNYVTDVVFTSSRSALPFRVFNTLDHQCSSRFNGYK